METLARAAPDPGALPLARLRAIVDEAVAASAAAATPGAAIEAALATLHDRLDAAGVTAFVLEHGRLWSVCVQGYPMIPEGLPLDQGVIGRTVQTASVQFAEDVAADPDFIEVSAAVVSELAVPLVAETGVVGVINIETTTRLPAGSADVVTDLARALAGPMDAVRASASADLSTLARLFVYMSSLREPTAIAEVAVRALGRLLPIETCRLLLLGEDGRLVPSVEWSASGRESSLIPVTVLETLRERIDSSAVFELLDAETDVPELAGLRLRSLVVLPLRANGSEVGLLIGSSRFARELDRGQSELAALLAAHAAASLDAAIALDRERRSAHTDPLTGLLNRRGFENRLDRELAQAQENRTPLSLAVLDCDDFKDVNDRSGHEYGDALLREVGLVLHEHCPEGAEGARLGGDEFVVMLPGLDSDDAVAVADRLRQKLGEGLDDAGFPLRLSAGISTYPYDGGGATQLLRSADQALYRAKAQGKNRVVAFREIVGASEAAGRSTRTERSRTGGADVTTLGAVMDTATAIGSEPDVPAVLDRLCKSLAFVVGATATAISRVHGDRLEDLAVHSLRDVPITDSDAFLLEDYPVTREVLEQRRVRSVSFLDEDIDSAEAFVLREVQMNAAMLLPLVVRDSPWALVELYDMRLRRFSEDQEAVAMFLVTQAARRIEMLDEVALPRRLRRLRRPS